MRQAGIITNADQEANLQNHQSSRIVSGENRGSGINFNGGQEIVNEHHVNKATTVKKHIWSKGRERVATIDTEASPGGASTSGWVNRQESGVKPTVASAVTHDHVKHDSSPSAVWEDSLVGERVVNVQGEGVSRVEKKDQGSELDRKSVV